MPPLSRVFDFLFSEAGARAATMRTSVTMWLDMAKGGDEEKEGNLKVLEERDEREEGLWVGVH